MARRFGVDLHVSRLLLETGLMCGKLARFDEAFAIVRAVKAFRDDVPHPGTSLAGVHLYCGQWQDAERELVAVLQAFPNHQLAKALLGFIYRETGRIEAERLLQEVIDDGRDEWAIRLAEVSQRADHAASAAATTAPSTPPPADAPFGRDAYA